MGVTASERIGIIQDCAERLASQPWSDVSLVLEAFGLPAGYENDFLYDARGYVLEAVKGASDTTLHELHDHLRQGHSVVASISQGRQGPVRVFFSHLTTHRAHVGEVAAHLRRFRVEAFVAHETIEPSKKWQDTIEEELRECDAAVAFLHESFKDSTWCDQEIGWVLGRNCPFLPLSYDSMPHGFMGKFQAAKVGQKSVAEVGRTIMDWLLKQEHLSGRLGTGLAEAFRASTSYDSTRTLADLLTRLPVLSEASLSVLHEAALSNDQVSNARILGQTGPEWVEAFIRGHRLRTSDS